MLSAESKYATPFLNNSNSLLLLLVRNLTSAEYRVGTGVICWNGTHTVHKKKTINYFKIKNLVEVIIYHFNTSKLFRTTGLCLNKQMAHHPFNSCLLVSSSDALSYSTFLETTIFSGETRMFCSAAEQSKKIKLLWFCLLTWLLNTHQPEPINWLQVL